MKKPGVQQSRGFRWQGFARNITVLGLLTALWSTAYGSEVAWPFQDEVFFADPFDAANAYSGSVVVSRTTITSKDIRLISRWLSGSGSMSAEWAKLVDDANVGYQVEVLPQGTLIKLQWSF